MLSLSFLLERLIIGIFSSVMLSYLGVYIVFRRIVFVCIALAQIITCGYVFGLFVNINPYFTSFIFSLIGILLFTLNIHSDKLPKESITALSYITSLCLSMIFIAKSAQAESYLLNVFSGDILTVEQNEVILSIVVFVLFFIVQGLFHKQFVFTSFDPETAEVHGYNKFFWDLIFYSLLSLAFITTIKTTGIIFSFGFVAIPAAFATLVFGRIKRIFIYSCICSSFSTIGGFVISYILDLPTGPTIVLTSFCLWTIILCVNKVFTR